MNKELAKDIGERVKTLRGKQSRSDFAYAFGVAPSSLARWEGGEAKPDLDFLVKLSGAFSVSLEWLVTGNEADPDPEHKLDYLNNLAWQFQPVAGIRHVYPLSVRSLPDRLRQLRGPQSQKAFADGLGVSQSSIANYENGRLPDVGFIESVCHKYNVSSDWLIFGVGLEQPLEKSGDVAAFSPGSDSQPVENIASEKTEPATSPDFALWRAVLILVVDELNAQGLQLPGEKLALVVDILCRMREKIGSEEFQSLVRQQLSLAV